MDFDNNFAGPQELVEKLEKALSERYFSTPHLNVLNELKRAISSEKNGKEKQNEDLRRRVLIIETKAVMKGLLASDCQGEPASYSGFIKSGEKGSSLTIVRDYDELHIFRPLGRGPCGKWSFDKLGRIMSMDIFSSGVQGRRDTTRVISVEYSSERLEGYFPASYTPVSKEFISNLLNLLEPSLDERIRLLASIGHTIARSTLDNVWNGTCSPPLKLLERKIPLPEIVYDAGALSLLRNVALRWFKSFRPEDNEKGSLKYVEYHPKKKQPIWYN